MALHGSTLRFNEARRLTPALPFLAATIFATSALSETDPYGCDYFKSSESTEDNPAVLELLADAPEGWVVRHCKDLNPIYYSVLSPVSHFNGVSYYYAYLLREHGDETREGRFADDALFASMMTVNDKVEAISWWDEGFIETDFVTVGAFKKAYLSWESMLSTPEKRAMTFDLSTLTEEDRIAFTSMMKSVDSSSNWRVFGIAFGYNDENERPPHYSIDIDAGDEPWSVGFDFTDPDSIFVHYVSKGVY